VPSSTVLSRKRRRLWNRMPSRTSSMRQAWVTFLPSIRSPAKETSSCKSSLNSRQVANRNSRIDNREFSMRILFVEDSAILRRTVKRGLRHAGFSVDLAADGAEGLVAAETNSYDVIILDIMLPKIDGLTLLRRLRTAGKNTHVLLLTARDTVADRVEGL